MESMSSFVERHDWRRNIFQVQKRRARDENRFESRCQERWQVNWRLAGSLHCAVAAIPRR